jgi:hypothetical protein
MKHLGVCVAALILAILVIGELSHSLSGWTRLTWAIAETLSPFALIYLVIKAVRWSKTNDQSN